MTEKIEVLEEEITEEGSTFIGGVRRVLMAGIGAFALAQEEVEDFVNKLIERGEIAEKDGRKLVNDILERRKGKTQETTKRVENELEKRFESLLDKMNIPTKNDIEALTAKVTELSKKVDELKKNM
ncbi:MAG: phasin family protein [Anaerolineales bacterium]|nr:phasin family protein [Anaerolineales bacterium]